MSGSSRTAVSIALVFGAIVVLLGGCASAPPASEDFPVLGTIESPTGAYVLEPMLGGWSRRTDLPANLADSDLVLVHAELGVMAIIYVNPGVADSLDEVVLARRHVLKSNWEVVSFEERREFQSARGFIPVSISSYHIRSSPSDGWSPVISAVVRGRSRVVEIYAVGGRPPSNEDLVMDLVSGLRMVSPAEDQR